MIIRIHSVIVALAMLSSFILQPSTVQAQGTAFTYQGRLNDGANPAAGSYDLRFAIYDAASAGAQQGNLLTNSPTGVTNGLFTVTLDFGNQFPGAARWLEIAVRTNGGSSLTTLAPRQLLTPAPYAITAGNVISGGIASGSYGNQIVFNNANNSFSGSFSGNGANVTNVNATSLNGLSSSNFWQLGGNNVSPGQFLGSTNNQPVEIWAGGARALRLEPNTNGAPNIIGGAPINVIAPGVSGAVIAGGGAANLLGFAYTNAVSSDFAAIGGGYNNTIQDGAFESTIGGGSFNVIQTNAHTSTIGGGNNNYIQTDASTSTIGGGYNNMIQPSAYESTIGGGFGNRIVSFAGQATIGGGSQNRVQSNAPLSTIGGGYDNLVSFGLSATIAGGYKNWAGNDATAQGNYSSVGGGSANVAEGDNSTVPGGHANWAAGNYSFAAGNHAKAMQDGTFVWADSQSADYSSTAVNQFCIRAAGGVQLDNSTSQYFGNQTRQMLNLWNTSYGIGVQNNTEYFRTGVGFAWYLGGVHSDTQNDSGGGSILMILNNGGLAVNGTFVSASDRNAKENFMPLDAQEILRKVAALPISRWNYKNDAAVPHLGPMAQDFYAAFDVGPDDRHIAVVDESGVALSAIQGLNQKLDEKDAEIQLLKEKAGRVDSLEKRLNELEQIVQSLAANK